MSHILVELKQLHLQINQSVILRDISLELQRGEIVTLIGPNGSGKSSLVKVVVGLLKPVQAYVCLRLSYVLVICPKP
jgi:zinc transport system ATP-binding protein